MTFGFSQQKSFKLIVCMECRKTVICYNDMVLCVDVPFETFDWNRKKRNKSKGCDFTKYKDKIKQKTIPL